MKQLPFAVERQQQTNWCWAAVAASIAFFYEHVQNWTQCLLATQVLPGDCCNNPGGCDFEAHLDRAIAHTGHLAAFVGGFQPFMSVRQEIDGDRVLAARIQWHLGNGKGHFVVISGYDETTNVITVHDPENLGPIDYDYDTFVTAYRQGAGTWSHAYFTN